MIFTRSDKLRPNVDRKAAADLFEIAAKAGNARAQLRYGYSFSSGNGRAKSARRAFAWFLRAAQSWDTDAIFSVALAYRDGDGVAVDSAQAFAWLLFGAHLDDPECASDLGYAYHDGVGTEIDRVEAVRWYRVAARDDVLRGMYNLGLCFLHGDGVEADASAAYQLLARASREGHEASHASLARAKDALRAHAARPQADAVVPNGAAVEDGDRLYRSVLDAIVRNDDDRAPHVPVLKRAASLGSRDAAYVLGNWYLNGTGVRKNLRTAVRWMTAAAHPSRRDHTCAYAELGVFYARGEGAPLDPIKSFAAYLRAALRGDRESAFRVACAYSTGDGVNCDAASARAWFERVDALDAANHGAGPTGDECPACEVHLRQSKRRVYGHRPDGASEALQ